MGGGQACHPSEQGWGAQVTPQDGGRSAHQLTWAGAAGTGMRVWPQRARVPETGLSPEPRGGPHTRVCRWGATNHQIAPP